MTGRWSLQTNADPDLQLTVETAPDDILLIAWSSLYVEVQCMAMHRLANKNLVIQCIGQYVKLAIHCNTLCDQYISIHSAVTSMGTSHQFGDKFRVPKVTIETRCG